MRVLGRKRGLSVNSFFVREASVIASATFHIAPGPTSSWRRRPKTSTTADASSSDFTNKLDYYNHRCNFCYCSASKMTSLRSFQEVIENEPMFTTHRLQRKSICIKTERHCLHFCGGIDGKVVALLPSLTRHIFVGKKTSFNIGRST